jgi:DNA repair protein RadD
MIVLREYQERNVADLRYSFATGHRAPLLQSPTGSGKTAVLAAIVSGANGKGKRVLVVAHRRELIKQICEKLTWAGVPHGIICPGFKPDPDQLVQVASIQTLARRLDKIGTFDLIIFDEVHHAIARQWAALIESQPNAKLLGVTATVARLDGKGLGIEHGGFFDDLIIGPSIKDLIADGFLSPCRVFAPAEKIDLSGVRISAGDYVTADLEEVVAKIVGDPTAMYRHHADHLPAIAYCTSVKTAEATAERSREAGYRAACVHGKTPTAERDAAIAGLGNGSIEVLTSCDLISEGLDVPAVGAVLLLRPTKSLVLYMQQVGPGMRPAPGKDCLVVLDHVGNSLVHGLPDLERRWSLAGVEKKPREEDAPRAVNEEGRNGREPIEEVAGHLEELTANRLNAIRRMSYRQVLNARLTKEELTHYAMHRGYRSGWVRHRLREQQAVSA